jgi:hypothetical protein
MKYCARNPRIHDSDQPPTVSLRPPCLSVDQIQRELEAIAAFDNLFLARSEHCADEIVGLELRKLRGRNCSDWPSRFDVWAVDRSRHLPDRGGLIMKCCNLTVNLELRIATG